MMMLRVMWREAEPVQSETRSRSNRERRRGTRERLSASFSRELSWKGFARAESNSSQKLVTTVSRRMFSGAFDVHSVRRSFPRNRVAFEWSCSLEDTKEDNTQNPKNRSRFISFSSFARHSANGLWMKYLRTCVWRRAKAAIRKPIVN